MKIKLNNFRAALIITLAHLLICSSLWAQSPNKFSYQAVVRNGSGVLVQNSNVSFRISILQSTSTGTVVYSETHIVGTNANGLASLEIGGGTVISGVFANINWSAGPYFLKTETDPAGGTNYTAIVGTTQLLSVPYALHAKTVSSYPETDPVWSTASGDYYSKTNLETSGSSFVHFNNLTNKPTTLSGYGITNAMSTSHAANGITSDNITNWTTAYTWGDHAGLYRPIDYVPAWSEISNKPTTLAGYGITNGMSTSHAANGISAANISNWTTAYNWGNHAGLYRPVDYVPTWTEITSKPTTISGFGITDAVTITGNQTITGDKSFTGAFNVQSGDFGTLTTGNFISTANGLFSQSLTVQGSVYFNNSLTVAGSVTVNDLFTVNRILRANDQLIVEGNLAANSDLSVSNTLYVQKRLMFPFGCITIDGFVGIGNTNPTAKLDITGNLKIFDGTQAAGKVLTSDADGLASWQAASPNATHTGDVTGSGALTLSTVNSSVGTFNNITINAKGLATAGSNASYLTAEADPNAVLLTGNQTVAGNKTFTGTTTVPTPVNATDAATKAYVDVLQNQITTLKNTMIAGGMVTDFDGNTYNTVKIGNQVWMSENLKTAKYNDGTPISNLIVDATWASAITGAYCDYSNTPANSTTYGRLYNWYAVDNNLATKVASNGGKNVCPTGWHVPSDAEWTTLESYLIANGYNYDGTTTGNKIAKALASTTLWTSSATTGAVGNTDYPDKRNATGFTVRPGGGRLDNGTFFNIGDYGLWWSSTGNSSTDAWDRNMLYFDITVYRGVDNKKRGFSVRCVKD
jgi:uncharacterized protein (TIGR02145 family)